MFCVCLFVCFSKCADFISICCFSTLKKVIKGIGWLDDRHGPSPILCDTVTLLVYIDQLFCRCVFIYSNFHWQLVSLFRDASSLEKRACCEKAAFDITFQHKTTFSLKTRNRPMNFAISSKFGKPSCYFVSDWLTQILCTLPQDAQPPGCVT